MKLSVSLSERDIETLDRFAAQRGIPSRSAAVQAAIRRLRELDLAEEYAAAIDEWDASDEEAVWGRAASDGLEETHAAR